MDKQDQDVAKLLDESRPQREKKWRRCKGHDFQFAAVFRTVAGFYVLLETCTKCEKPSLTMQMFEHLIE